MGYRPPVPENMPQGFKDLLLACWVRALSRIFVPAETRSAAWRPDYSVRSSARQSAMQVLSVCQGHSM